MRMPDLKNEAVRRNATRGWVALSLLWSFTRAALIWHVFGSHGTNGFGYLLVDLATTIPYAIYSARAAFAWIDRSPEFARNLLISVTCFLAPDAYVVVTARNVAPVIWFGFGAFVTLMAIFAIKFARKS
jgi:hypothetical protein